MNNTNTNTNPYENGMYPCTPELFNLLTLQHDDFVDEYTREELLDMIFRAAESVNQ